MAEGSNSVNDFEPVDVSKRQYIENVVEPDMHAAITQLANARKKFPLKCIKEARKEANNNIYYYGKACVMLETEAQAQSFSASQVDVCEINGADVPASVDTLSKSVTTCSEERRELLKAQKMLNRKLDVLSGSKNDFKHRPFSSPHFYNDDFVIDENVPLHVEM